MPTQPDAPPIEGGGRNVPSWRRAIRASVSARWPRARGLALAALSGAWLVCCVLLVASGYPAWRTAAFTCIALVSLVPHALRRLGGWSLPSWASEESPAVFLLLGSLFTGGIYSPVIVAALGSQTQRIQTGGVERRTVLGLVAFSSGLALIGLAPRSWVGPPPSHLVYAPGLLAFLIPTVYLQAQHSSVVAGALEELVRQVLRARDEVASQWLARARELEVLTVKLSQELQDPLEAVRARVRLATQASADPETREQLGVVESEVARMQSILEEYLTFSRPLESLRPEPLQLGPLADEVLAAMEGRARAAGVALGRRGDGRIRADPRRLTEALLNLLANSIEATPPGGRVTLAISDRQRWLELTVQDTGKGMPPEVLARLGSPFFTTRRQGTGLGVLLARSVFTQHGGSLHFQSKPGQGTVATGLLPGNKEDADGIGAARG